MNQPKTPNDGAAGASGNDLRNRERPMLTVCLPAFNEETNLAACLDEAREVLPRLAPSYEIVIVDDGSTDATSKIAADYAALDDRIHLTAHDRNRGYGEAVSTAFARARGELVMLMDADRQFRLADLPPFLECIKDHDLVVGFRSPRADGLGRRFNAWAWGRLVRLLLGIRPRDLDCAYKLFRRQVIEKLTLTAAGSAISAEIMLQCKRRGYRVAELPVRHYPRGGGRPTGSNWRVIARALAELPRLVRYRRSEHPR